MSRSSESILVCFEGLWLVGVTCEILDVKVAALESELVGGSPTSNVVVVRVFLFGYEDGKEGATGHPAVGSPQISVMVA